MDALVPLGACTSDALWSLWACRTGHPGDPLSALNALSALSALNARGALHTRAALRPCSALRPIGAGHSGRTLHSCGALGAGRAVSALRPGHAL